MAATQTRTNAEVIAWAIDESGFTPDEIAKSVGVSCEAVQSWVDGGSTPTRGQLTKLAAKLHRPFTLFYLNSPPQDASLPTGLRVAQGREPRVLRPEERLSIRRAMRRQALISELRENDGPVELPRLSREMSPQEAGGVLREWSTISVGEQYEWGSDSEAFQAWRGALEFRRVVPMQLVLGRNGLRGFTLPDSFAPVAAVNSAESFPARSFTLWHEMAHLGLGEQQSCLSLRQEAVAIERWCDQTANAVLIPRDDVASFANRETIAKLSSLEQAKKAARRFKVSIRAATIAMINVEVLPETAYKAIDAQLAADDAKRSGGGGGGGRKRHEIRIAEVGLSAARTVSDALSSRSILEIEARRALDLDGADLALMQEIASDS